MTGIVRGLTDNATSAASSVEILSNSSGFGVGEFVGLPDENAWTVSSGVITVADFVSFGDDNTAPDVTDSSLGFSFNYLTGETVGGLTHKGFLISTSFKSIVTFEPVERVPGAVPLPAAGVLLAGALGGLGWFGRKRRSA